MKNLIVTISRQYGSGGRSIGQQLAKELGIPFYDKEIIDLAARRAASRRISSGGRSSSSPRACCFPS